jgi:general secretion pathway protein A
MGRDQGNGQVSGQPGLFGWSRPAVSSRRYALDRLRAAVSNGQDGPALITGEPGAGKTWLSHRLVEELPAGWQSARADLSPGMDELEFLRVVGDSLGLSVPKRIGAARAVLAGSLRDDATDGRPWLLVVDEAQRGSWAVWGEVQSLINRMGRPGGFAALVILGHTELARALETRELAALSASLSDHIHLMPIDLDEARELLGLVEPIHLAGERRLEELHRDAAGNPSRLLRLAGLRRWLQPPGLDAHHGLFHDAEISHGGPIYSTPDFTAEHSGQPYERRRATDTPPDPISQISMPPLIPTKPPIRVEEGLVEVGWEGDLEAESLAAREATPSQAPPPSDDLSGNEELVQDRYAALQAWREWKQNQERAFAKDSANPAVEEEGECGSGSGATAAWGPTAGNVEPHSRGQGPTSLPAHVRAESQHDFAPYSQLFSRLRQSREPGA